MKRSTDRILTTHTGSLPQSPDLHRAHAARAAGEPVDEAALAAGVKQAVADIVRRQVDAGLTIVNDGEQGKSSWSSYVWDRLYGFSGENVPRPVPSEAALFPDYFARNAGITGEPRVACNGPVSWKDFSAVEQDIANLKAATAGLDVADVFMSASSPGNISNFHPNRYYQTEEQYLEAIAEMMRREYEAIVAAGFILQLDCPDLAIKDIYFPEATKEEFRKIAAQRIEALNYATRNIPPESMRLHMCWGRGEGARVHNLPLSELVDLLLKARPMGLAIANANGRHEYEWRVWQDVKLPDGKVLIPGVIDNTTSIIEHPETVADRLERFANVAGRENVIGGVNCGFGNAPIGAIPDNRIIWAKLQALAEGAAIASDRLW